MLLKIAFRNVLRNRRRSILTTLAIAIGAVAIVLFGEYVAFVKAGLETSAVHDSGHLTIFREGYFDYGSGNPASYAINDYRAVIGAIRSDPTLEPTIAVITPTVSLTGIAGNFDIDASKTFFGVGFLPSDRDKMQQWDGYDIRHGRPAEPSGLRDDDASRCMVGAGLARVLGLCQALGLEDCPPRPAPSGASDGAPLPSDIATLAANERGSADPHAADKPRLDFLAAMAGGAPNVVSLIVDSAEEQGARDLDNNFVAMHLSVAQRLLFGGDDKKAVGIVLQLRDSKDLNRVRARLEALFAEQKLGLEVYDFTELQPFYKQATGMFRAVFAFIFIVMTTIVLFTVLNTVGMSVMERTSEIGTARALGVRRSGIRRLFILEGAILGMLGATMGILVGQGLAMLFNHAGATWTPPGQSSPVPLEVMTSSASGLLLRTWLCLVLVAILSSVMPAGRAARMKVVDALRYV